jgi:hypothetical protein
MISVVNKYKVNSNCAECVYIGRGSGIGNPYSHKKSKYISYQTDTREQAVHLFQDYFFQQLRNHNKQIIEKIKHILRMEKKHGEVKLVCFCAPKPCHGDIIKRAIELFRKLKK